MNIIPVKNCKLIHWIFLLLLLFNESLGQHIQPHFLGTGTRNYRTIGVLRGLIDMEMFAFNNSECF